jgi:hypothetical protein
MMPTSAEAFKQMVIRAAVCYAEANRAPTEVNIAAYDLAVERVVDTYRIAVGVSPTVHKLRLQPPPAVMSDVEKAKRDDPDGAICGWCGKENDNADDCGWFWYAPIAHKRAPACLACEAKIRPAHIARYGVGDR